MDMVQQLRPSEQDYALLEVAFSVVSEILRHALAPFGVLRIVRAGSFAKRTMLRGRMELDLVVILRQFDPKQLDTLQGIAAKAIQERGLSVQKKALACTTHVHAHTVELQGGVKVDILITGELRDGAFTFLQIDPDHRPAMSPAAVTIIVDFIGNQSQFYKDMVSSCLK